VFYLDLQIFDLICVCGNVWVIKTACYCIQ